MKRFERYNLKFGCLAVKKDGIWYVVKPNGSSERVGSHEEAKFKAEYLNATALPCEHE